MKYLSYYIISYKNRRDYGDSLLRLNTLVLLSRKPTLLKWRQFTIAYYKIFEKDENVYIAIKIINDNNDKTNETEYYFVVNKCNQNVINYKNQDILNNLNLKWKKFSNK